MNQQTALPESPAPPTVAETTGSSDPHSEPVFKSALATPWKVIVACLTVAGLGLAINQAFFLGIGGSLLTNQYLYLILGAFLPIVFILFPAVKSAAGSRVQVPWYDLVIAAVTLVTCVYLGVNGERIISRGWDYIAPPPATIASFLLWAAVLEALRRTAGWVVTVIAGVFSVYPLFASSVPVPFLQGTPYPVKTTGQIHALGVDSILGLPLQTAGSVLIGFLLFGVALQHSGGAQFFYNFAMSIFGRVRGGSAKVCVVSSSAMGMMSGSAVSNVLTTGPMTIPAMKRAGFSATVAGGIEATAATGGTIMPPVMGTAAFLMVSFVGVPYAQIALAATIPAVLYYWGILLQVDGYAARRGLTGMPKNQLPKFFSTLTSGWIYLAALFGLLILLMLKVNENQAPYWIVLFLLMTMLFQKEHKLTPASFFNFILASGKTIAEIIGVIAGVGLIVGGLSMTGVSLSLAGELISVVGDNVFLILIAGAVTSFVLGMGMTVSAVYVFLAIIMAPALTNLGINPIAAHLFVIYWATVSYITPPVALASFAAANISGAPPMQTALQSMRLGAVKYLVPFAFVLNPALVGQAGIVEIATSVLLAFVGVYLLASAFEGYLTITGSQLSVVLRVCLAGAGLAMLWPSPMVGLIGAGIGAAIAVTTLIMKRSEGKAHA